MKRHRLSILCLWLALISLAGGKVTYAQDKAPAMLLLSKDAGGTMAGTSLTLTLRANPTCDQTGEAFPDGSQLLATELTFLTEDNRLGIVSGSVQIKAPDGQVLRAIEDSRVNIDHSGDGVYRFYLPGGALMRGAPYCLASTA